MKSFIVNITQRIEYIVDRFPWTYPLFESYYAKIVDNEIELADIQPTDRILCIGGGPCPCTAIELHRKTGAKVCVIDNDREVIDMAIKNIEKMNLSDFITVECQDGKDIDVTGFSIIHIALQVSPKEKVYQSLIKKSTPGTKIMVRISKDHFSRLYSGIKKELMKNDDRIYHQKKNLDYTLLHVTTGGVNEKVLDSDTRTDTTNIAI